MRRGDDQDGSYSKRRRTSQDGTWEQQQNLFEEPEYREVDRRLERAISEITLEMLEAVRLAPSQLLHILEHPRCTEYLVGAYVRYPDLEEIENGDYDESQYASIPPLPAQITKLTPREQGPSSVVIDEEAHNVHYDFSIIQYTQRSDGSLKIRKGKMYLPLVQKGSFTEAELGKWQNLLKMFSGRQGYEKLQSLPLILPATASKLKSFTFTNDDVEELLRQKMTTGGPYAHVAALNFRDLYIRKSELEYNLKSREEELEDATSDEAVGALQEEIEKLRGELKVVNERVSQHESTQTTKTPTELPRSVGASREDNVMGDTLWKSLEWVKMPRSLCWRQPMSYLDVLYPVGPVKDSSMRAFTDRWRSDLRSRASEIVDKINGSVEVGNRLVVDVHYSFIGPKRSAVKGDDDVASQIKGQ